jgi:hypothetical protein
MEAGQQSEEGVSMGRTAVNLRTQEEVVAFGEFDLRRLREFISSHDQPTEADFDALWERTVKEWAARQ